jgi:hypothetical protein
MKTVSLLKVGTVLAVFLAALLFIIQSKFFNIRDVTIDQMDILNLAVDSVNRDASAAPRNCVSTDSFALPDPLPKETALHSIDGLLASDFCQYMECAIHTQWHDENQGLVSTEYQLSTRLGDTSADGIAISTQQNALTMIMFSFHKRKNLCDGDARLVTSLLHSLHPDGDAKSMGVAIAKEMAVPSSTLSHDWGKYRLFPGYLSDDGHTLLIRRTP